MGGGVACWPGPPSLAALPNVLPLPGVSMRDAAFWRSTAAFVARNLDALVSLASDGTQPLLAETDLEAVRALALAEALLELGPHRPRRRVERRRVHRARILPKQRQQPDLQAA